VQLYGFRRGAGEHLADQVMLRLALAGGRYSIDLVPQHARTNAEIIAGFLPARIRFEACKNCAVCDVEATN
jgi:RNA 3'-terminal phosphate cyclase (ATP)